MSELEVFAICSRGYADECTAFYAGRIDVYLPHRDSPQVSGREWETVGANLAKLKAARTVEVWWDGASQGALVDLGAALVLEKPIIIRKWNQRTWSCRLGGVLDARETDSARVSS